MDASINVEVFSGTSDRFGGKIAAVMYRPLGAESAAGRRACADGDALGAARPCILRAGAVRRGQACSSRRRVAAERRRKIGLRIRTVGVPSRLVRWRHVANGS